MRKGGQYLIGGSEEERTVQNSIQILLLHFIRKRINYGCCEKQDIKENGRQEIVGILESLFFILSWYPCLYWH